MEEFIISVMFTLPGYLFLTCCFGEGFAKQRSTFQIVLVSIFVWIVACLIVYAAAYSFASVFQ
jgi:hypothetical protein